MECERNDVSSQSAQFSGGHSRQKDVRALLMRAAAHHASVCGSWCSI